MKYQIVLKHLCILIHPHWGNWLLQSPHFNNLWCNIFKEIWVSFKDEDQLFQTNRPEWSWMWNRAAANDCFYDQFIVCVLDEIFSVSNANGCFKSLTWNFLIQLVWLDKQSKTKICLVFNDMKPRTAANIYNLKAGTRQSLAFVSWKWFKWWNFGNNIVIYCQWTNWLLQSFWLWYEISNPIVSKSKKSFEVLIQCHEYIISLTRFGFKAYGWEVMGGLNLRVIQSYGDIGLGLKGDCWFGDVG